jgi:hypothetical protein
VQYYRREEDLQRAVAQYLDARGFIWFHPANERKTEQRIDKKGRSYSPEGNKLKALGVKPGLPDCVILNVRIVIELKIGKNKPTPAQERWLETFRELGWQAHVCRSLDEVMEILEQK